MIRSLTIFILLFSTTVVFSQSELAQARADKDWGIIDKNGSYGINPQFPKHLPLLNSMKTQTLTQSI